MNPFDHEVTFSFGISRSKLVDGALENPPSSSDSDGDEDAEAFPSALPDPPPVVEGDVPSAFGFPSAGVVPDPAEGPSSSGGMPASGEAPISGFPPISLGSPISGALPMPEEPLFSRLFSEGFSSGSWPWMISWTFFSMADWIRPSPSDMARYSKPAK